MLDTSLVTTNHFLVFIIVFAALAAAFAYRAAQGKRYAGLILALGVTLAATLYIPSTAARSGLLLALLLIGVIGIIDERAKLHARWQLFWQLCIAGILVFSGWIIPYVSNPFAEGVIDLRLIAVGNVALPAALAAVAWIVLMMNAVNWLDGADGLASGVTLVGFFALAAVAMLPSIYNASGFGLALAGAAGVLAFFIWNFPSAKLYLGTVGSWFIGMYIAIVAMQGGGKIATVLLILALPVFDVCVVMMRRLFARHPIWEGDTNSHVHHRLQQAGISGRQIVLAAMVVTGILAFISIFLTPAAKLLVVAVGVLGVLAAGLRLGIGQRMLKRSKNYETANALPRR